MHDGLAFPEALTFDDVLLIPQKSDVLPRDVNLQTRLTKQLHLEIPLVSSPMDTVTESAMAIAMGKEGGLGIIHKNLDVDKQVEHVKKVKQAGLAVGAAVSVGDKARRRAEALIEARVDVIVVDSAHGHSQGVLEMVAYLKKTYPNLNVIGGNVATTEATRDLIKAGADAVKIGIGPGSICTTRIVTGIGVPQLTAIMQCAKEAHQHGVPIVADGGIRYSGDIVKALAAGADCVMMGGALAGTDEAPGEVIEQHGQKFKTYRGMGSLEAMQLGSKDRYLQESITETKKLVPEGIVGKVVYKGSVDEVVYQLLGGLRAGLGYCGAATIEALQHRAQFVRVTNAGIRESHPHSLAYIGDAPNYTLNM
ncbi:MAG: IMP dehydrogenase [Candidatus Kerfeldbacteria bacterium]|nr:IMP dehydrogenase [Candidatus Kerfeldbacteria bacterium]